MLWGLIVMSSMRLAYLVRLNATNENVISKLIAENKIEIDGGKKVLIELNQKELELQELREKLKQAKNKNKR